MEAFPTVSELQGSTFPFLKPEPEDPLGTLSYVSAPGGHFLFLNCLKPKPEEPGREMEISPLI